MFNFTAMNQALSDVNVSDKEFRMLYLFANNSSLNENDEIEMYNGFLMDKLNLSERQVQRLTKSLVEKNYLTKVVKGTSKNRNGNTYRLNYNITEIRGDKNVTHDIDSDITCDTSCDKNVTPNNRTKENKNISMYKEESVNENIYVRMGTDMDATDTFTEIEVTDEDKSISVQGEGKVEVATSSVAGTEIDEDTSIEDKESSPRVKLSKEEITRRNDYISKVFERLDTKLNYLYTLRTFSLYNDVCAEIVKVFTDAQEHREYFTDGQWEKCCCYCDRFDKLTEAKDSYFNGARKKDADADVTSTDVEKNFTEKCIDGSDDSSIDGGGVRREIKPTDWEKVNAWVSSSLDKFSTYAEWQKELDRILNKKFGDGWESAEYEIMAQASAIYNRCNSAAVQYYRSNETTPTPSESNTDLAPWETNKEDTHAEIDPTLDGYLTPSVEDATEATQGAPDSTSDVQPNNYPSDEIETHTEPLNEPVTDFGDTVEPDDEDMAFDDYIVISQASRTATEYGYRYAV